MLRHRLFVRIAHWINAISFAFLLWSGIAILYAYPRFHLGTEEYINMPSLFDVPIPMNKEFNAWARPMHFSFAWLFFLNGGLYILCSLVTGHLRDSLSISRKEISIVNLRRELVIHADPRKFWRNPEMDYNLFQRLAYGLVIFLLCPLMLLTGLTMAPAFVASFPWLLDVFHGRQTARLIHFIAANLLTAFLVIHLVQVIATRPIKQLRAMIMGYYDHPWRSK